MEKVKCFWKVFVIIQIVLAVIITALVFVHRRLIRAAVKNEPLPVCPHWFPGKIDKILSDQ